MLKGKELVCPRCAQIITKHLKWEGRRYIRGYDSKTKKYRFDIFCIECYPYEIPTLKGDIH
jgi:hypothetical protein